MTTSKRGYKKKSGMNKINLYIIYLILVILLSFTAIVSALDNLAADNEGTPIFENGKPKINDEKEIEKKYGQDTLKDVLRLNVFYPPSIDFVDPTPVNGTGSYDNDTHITVNVTSNPSGDPIDAVKMNWNGTDIILDSPALVGWWNLSNNTNDSSRYANHGTFASGNGT